MYPGLADPSLDYSCCKMGHDKRGNNMDSRPGSASSGQRSNSAVRGQPLRSSPFCPRSSSKTAQSLLKDHMVSHYKKIYSAKAAVDTSVPKSLILSVKYNDQLRRKQFKDGRPPSALSVSPRSSRASLYTPPSRSSVQSEGRPYLSSRNSSYSSTFGTSFHAHDVVYAHHKAASQTLLHTGASDAKYPRSAPYKGSQSSDRKTYGGDLLKQHSQHFTQDKPFTPKTLKSDKSSYLSRYRYYRAPLKKPSLAHVMQQEKDDGSTKSRKGSDAPSQGLSTEPEWSADDFSGSDSPETSHQSPVSRSRSRSRLLFGSPPGALPVNTESSTLAHVFAEEEEIMYLKLISAVTEDILSRGHISDRILNLVMQRHIDMNRHHLEEGKMRHLMELLRKEFQTDVSTCSAGPEKTETRLFEAFHSHLESRGKEPKQKSDLPSYMSSNSPDLTPGGPLVSTPVCSPKRTPSPLVINEEKREKDSLDSRLSGGVASTTEADEVDPRQSQVGTKATDVIGSEGPQYGSKEWNQGDGVGCCDGQTGDLRDLEGLFSESLHVSSNTAVTEQHAEGSSSDGEF